MEDDTQSQVSGLTGLTSVSQVATQVTQLRKVLNSLQGQLASLEENQGWVQALSTKDEGCENDVAMDSGASVQECPLDWGEEYGLVSTVPMELFSADGTRIKHYGQRQIPLVFKDLEEKEWVVVMKFEVADVGKPLFCASAWNSLGFGIFLQGQQSRAVHTTGRAISMSSRHNLFYLKCKFRAKPQQVAAVDGEAVPEAPEPQGEAAAAGDKANPEVPWLDDAELEQSEEPKEKLKVPEEPTAAERARHLVCHEPFAPWCKFFVAGKSREDRHEKKGVEEKNEEKNLIALDYQFPVSRSGAKSTQLTAVDLKRKGVFSTLQEEGQG